MKKTQKFLILAGSVLVGAMSLVPLASYAEEPTEKNGTVTVSVKPTLKLDVASRFATVSGNAGNVLNTKIEATVSSNRAYSVGFMVANEEATNLRSPDTSIVDVIPASSDVRNNNSAWGIKKKNADGTDEAGYTAVTTTNVPFFSSTTGADARKLEFTVGISTKPGIASGSYSTDVTVTASN